MRDSRAIFLQLVTSKPYSWDDLQMTVVSDEQMKILMALPRKIVNWDTSPAHDMFYKAEVLRSERAANAPIEWVIERIGEEDGQLQYFYVNNESFSYSRYVFRFEPRSA